MKSHRWGLLAILLLASGVHAQLSTLTNECQSRGLAYPVAFYEFTPDGLVNVYGDRDGFTTTLTGTPDQIDFVLSSRVRAFVVYEGDDSYVVANSATEGSLHAKHTGISIVLLCVDRTRGRDSPVAPAVVDEQTETQMTAQMAEVPEFSAVGALLVAAACVGLGLARRT